MTPAKLSLYTWHGTDTTTVTDTVHVAQKMYAAYMHNSYPESSTIPLAQEMYAVYAARGMADFRKAKLLKTVIDYNSRRQRSRSLVIE